MRKNSAMNVVQAVEAELPGVTVEELAKQPQILHRTVGSTSQGQYALTKVGDDPTNQNVALLEVFRVAKASLAGTNLELTTRGYPTAAAIGNSLHLLGVPVEEWTTRKAVLSKVRIGSPPSTATKSSDKVTTTGGTPAATTGSNDPVVDPPTPKPDPPLDPPVMADSSATTDSSSDAPSGTEDWQVKRDERNAKRREAVRDTIVSNKEGLTEVFEALKGDELFSQLRRARGAAGVPEGALTPDLVATYAKKLGGTKLGQRFVAAHGDFDLPSTAWTLVSESRVGNIICDPEGYFGYGCSPSFSGMKMVCTLLGQPVERIVYDSETSSFLAGEADPNSQKRLASVNTDATAIVNRIRNMSFVKPEYKPGGAAASFAEQIAALGANMPARPKRPKPSANKGTVPYRFTADTTPTPPAAKPKPQGGGKPQKPAKEVDETSYELIFDDEAQPTDIPPTTRKDKPQGNPTRPPRDDARTGTDPKPKPTGERLPREVWQRMSPEQRGAYLQGLRTMRNEAGVRDDNRRKPQSSWFTSSSRWVRRHREGAMVAAAAALLLGIVVVGSNALNQSAPEPVAVTTQRPVEQSTAQAPAMLPRPIQPLSQVSGGNQPPAQISEETRKTEITGLLTSDPMIKQYLSRWSETQVREVAGSGSMEACFANFRGYAFAVDMPYLARGDAASSSQDENSFRRWLNIRRAITLFDSLSAAGKQQYASTGFWFHGTETFSLQQLLAQADSVSGAWYVDANVREQHTLFLAKCQQNPETQIR